MNISSRFAHHVVVALFAINSLIPLTSAAVTPGNGPPQPVSPPIVVVHDPANFNNLASINGSGFGPLDESSLLWAYDPTIDEHAFIPMGDPALVVWKNEQIVVELPANMLDAELRVVSSKGVSNWLIADYYEYDFFDTNALQAYTSGSNPIPLQLEIDAEGRVWILEEFQLDIKYWDPIDELVHRIEIPQASGTPPFAIRFDPDGAGPQAPMDLNTHISSHGDGITLDSHGRIWFTQGGAPYNGTLHNHSRLISYDHSLDPDLDGVGTFYIYNVPGDKNEVNSIAWDESRQAIWFTQHERFEGIYVPSTAYSSRLTSLKPYATGPNTIQPDNDFNFGAAGLARTCNVPIFSVQGTCDNAPDRICFRASDCVLADQVCPAGVGDDSECYHEYELPDVFFPGMIMVHSDGSIWYTNNFRRSNNITVEMGRLDPTPGSVDLRVYPLENPAIPEAANGPWDILETPNGDIVVGSYVENRVSRLAFSDISNTLCSQTLAGAGSESPCLEVKKLSELLGQTKNLLHGIIQDADGKLWFAQGGFETLATTPNAALVGYVTSDWKDVVVFPPLEHYPGNGNNCPLPGGGTFDGFSGAQMAIDPINGHIFFADLCRKRLGRLKKM